MIVVFGHGIGLLIPKTCTNALSPSPHAYHVQALTLGAIAGLATLPGVAILIYRRRTTGPVSMGTTTRDNRYMYVVSVAAVGMGCSPPHRVRPGRRGTMLASRSRSVRVHLIGAVEGLKEPVRRRRFSFIPRSGCCCSPRCGPARAPFSAPVRDLFGPYIVYCSHDPAGRIGEPIGSEPRRRGG